MVDRLRDREWADRWAFLLFAIGGSIAIWIAKSLGLDAIWVAGGAMMVMLAYAAVVSLGPKLKLRADQLGDNCYYLGLVFTLASLSYAIFTFDPARTATTIVQGFGVALVSTVLGLVLRVFFSQGQPDLAAAEDNARIALTETAAAVRAELDGVLLAFQTFAIQTQQHLAELRDQVRADVEVVSAGAREAVAASADGARAMLNEQSAETVDELRKATTSVGRLVKAIDGHADMLGAVAGKTSAQFDNLEMIERAGTAAAEALRQVSASAEALRTHQQDLAEGDERLAGIGTNVAATITALGQAAERFDELVEARLGALGEAPLKNAEALDAVLAKTLATWQTVISDHAEANARLLKDLEEARTRELAALHRHNEALDVEIERSRSKVGQVQAALVEMTNELTAQISASDR
ncbi:aminoglycoside N3'-acetyltransferase [Sphingopyxis sp. OAS728]|uniref:hypothetical protein n=1 Tax=Sphingopyxis sp. OAS728 TaxID=2663823 RepID=UPI00178B3BF9|nr:hypothetical protein [Sphingopyxis sp. OAS728]MBE1529542.1 aminoglycoside N3'-acetyltransferase [Sphingopyxis sp. OAS728]